MHMFTTKVTDAALVSESSEIQVDEGIEVLVSVKKPRLGDIVMAKKDNVVLFRQLKKYGRKKVLVALNSDYEDIEINSSIEIIGVADITKTGLDSVQILNFYRSLNETQKGIYSSMMSDYGSGKMNGLSQADLQAYIDGVTERLRLAA
jgi:hypothetical protein